MIDGHFLPRTASLVLAALLCACQQSNTGDEPEPSDVPSGLQRFLLFPNPIQVGGAFETDTDAYAEAYYRAIDPLNERLTLNAWKTKNSVGDAATGTEHTVVFRDVKDLGYGRRMTGRINNTHPDVNINGSVAFVVENYDIWTVSSKGYSSLNVEAAVARDTQWHIGTNAIEWSASPCTAEDPANCSNTVKFAKYYNFSATTGQRENRVDLDGKGLKAMPGACINCHGGRADPLTSDVGGNRRFALIENSLSRKRGDTQGRLQGLNVDSFEFSAQPGWTKADQQAWLKDFNRWVLCTYPLPGGGGTGVDACRPTAGANEWQGTAAEMIKAWYGGSSVVIGMPNDTFADTYVPAGWDAGATLPGTTLTDRSLYRDVVAPYCRTCHIVRGTSGQSDIDFMALGTATTKFRGYADRTKTHVFDRGNMPLALLVYEDFWKSSAPATLASYIDSVLGAGSATSGGAVLKPGRLIADPGPNRMVGLGAARLSGADSLFATTYSWSQTSGPGTAIIADANSMNTTFTPPLAGLYTFRLTVGNGATTHSKTVDITVDAALLAPTFASVRSLVQSGGCTGCHAPASISPIAYTDFDRDGVGGYVSATDDAWFHKELTGRVNLTEIQASPLLRKPSGNHHAGGGPYPAGLNNYSILYNWILEGMPQ